MYVYVYMDVYGDVFVCVCVCLSVRSLNVQYDFCPPGAALVKNIIPIN